jgi:hypothetical protein
VPFTRRRRCLYATIGHGPDAASHPSLTARAALGAPEDPWTGAKMIEHTTAGKHSLAGLADEHKTQPSAILRLTAEHSPGNAYPGDVAAYINGVFRGKIAVTEHMPAGLHLYLPQ